MVRQVLSTFQDTASLAYTSTIDPAGLLDLDLADGAVPFKRALKIRKARLGAEDSPIASSLINVALAYTEMGELALAYAAHE